MNQLPGVREIPFLRLVVPLLCGILTGFNGTGAWLFPVWSAAALVFAAFLVTLSVYRILRIYRKRWCVGLLVHLFIFFSGAALTLQAGKTGDAYKTKQGWQSLMVKVLTEPVLQGSLTRFEAEVTGGFIKNRFTSSSGKLVVLVFSGEARKQTVKYGDLLLVAPRIENIPPAYNPSEFDYSILLKRRQVTGQVFLSQAELKIVGRNRGNSLIAYSFDLRHEMVEKYRKYIKDSDASALASALVLGVRSAIDQETINDYSMTGTTHVLSVSGMHVGIVFIVLVAVLKFMDRNTWLRWLRALLVIGMVAGYAVFTGLSAAVCRAAMMLGLIVAAKAAGRQVHSFNVLAASAFLLLVCQPFLIADVGFQLSYLAMTGLFYIYPIIYESFTPSPSLDKLWSCLSVSMAAQLVTFPLSLYYFHQFPVYFLLSNVFIVLPVTVIMYLGIVFVFLPFSLLLNFTGTALRILIVFMNKGLSVIAHLPGSTVSGIWITPAECLLVYVLIGSILFILVYKKKKAIWVLLFALTGLAGFNCVRRMRNDSLQRLVVYTVRKHTAIGVFDRGKGLVFTDLAPKDKPYLFSVKPSFSSAGIGTDDLFSLSADFESPSVLARNHFIRFGNTKLLIWTKKINGLRLTPIVTADIVLLSGDPRIRIGDLQEQVRFRKLLADASNSDANIRRWKEQCARAGVDLYIVKNNPAYILTL